MPCAADHDDLLVTGSPSGADGTPHVGFALHLGGRRNEAVAGDGHRLGDGIERRRPVAAMLDDVLPPALRVGVTGGGGEVADRIGRRGLAHQVDRRLGWSGERHGEREVDGVAPERRSRSPRRSPAIRG